MRYNFLKIFNIKLCFCFLIFSVHEMSAQQNYISKVWVSDLGDGRYKNPVLHADYSDPDAIRVGDDFYMTSSSFEDIPGLPILHSKDLVNWRLIGHALKKQLPADYFSVPRHGQGVWAPSIRFHNGLFHIYYGDPDFGIYVVRSKDPAGTWDEPVLVEGGKGLIDPCPFWDDDGQAYLVHAYAGSRAGIKSILVLKKMNAEGIKTLDDGVLIYDGHEKDPTIEGPKFYKHNGWYYIFAPAGGVKTGWQTILRSKNIYGPYERRVVLDQGSTKINGPHQGAWVTTQKGENWFLHFQDKEAYGRVVHLQPMRWMDDWPVIGEDRDGDARPNGSSGRGKGEPFMNFKKPDVGKIHPIVTPTESDEFDGDKIGMQWQWPANLKPTWVFLDKGNNKLRLYAYRNIDSVQNLWNAPNVLQQKFPAEEFTVTTKLSFHPDARLENEKAGLAVMGTSYASLFIHKTKDGFSLNYEEGNEKDIAPAKKLNLTSAKDATVYFRVKVKAGAVCTFSYSYDGNVFTEIKESFIAKPGRWKGAKIGIFCTGETISNDMGFADFDWVRVEPE
jgi:beta-xylosidase